MGVFDHQRNTEVKENVMPDQLTTTLRKAPRLRRGHPAREPW
jgi:hypothetical protein